MESLIASGLQKIGDDIASDIAQDLGIHDFYSAHVLTFCEGYYNPNGTAPNPSQNVTYCSKKSAGYWFNPTNVVSSELKHGVTLADVKWPSQIDDSLNYIRHGSKAYFVIYIIAIVLTGIFVITSLLGIFLGRGVALANFFLGFVSDPFVLGVVPRDVGTRLTRVYRSSSLPLLLRLPLVLPRRSWSRSQTWSMATARTLAWPPLAVASSWP